MRTWVVVTVFLLVTGCAISSGAQETTRADVRARFADQISKLTALRKPGGGVRPIAAPSLLRRLAGRLLVSTRKRELATALGKLRDGHPDFHAVRVRVMLALAESPMLVPWDLRRECALYILKLSHVSARCRLALAEESRALELCKRREVGRKRAR